MHWGKIIKFYLLREGITMKVSMYCLYISLGTKLCITIFTCNFYFLQFLSKVEFSTFSTDVKAEAYGC